jgi:hypothetical protein
MTISNIYVSIQLERLRRCHCTPKVVSSSQVILAKLRNIREHCLPLFPPHTLAHSKEIPTNKAMNSRKFPVDMHHGSANWTFVEQHLPEGM